MNTATIIAVIAIVLILFFAVRYIRKEKKKGKAQVVRHPFTMHYNRSGMRGRVEMVIRR